MSKSTVISIRVKPYKLAKLLTGILKHNPSFDPESPGKTIQAAIDIAINQTCFGLPLEPDPKAQRIVDYWNGRKTEQKEQTRRFLESLTEQTIMGPRNEPAGKMTMEDAMKEGERLQEEMIRKSQSDKKLDPRINDIDLGSQKDNVEDFRPMSEDELSALEDNKED